MSFQNKISTVAILGGDARQTAVAYMLASNGYSLHLWGIANWRCEIEDDVTVYEDWQRCVQGVDAVILPLPITFDGIRLNASAVVEEKRPRLDLLFRTMEGNLMIAGRISQELCDYAELHKIECIDYFESENLQLKNALSTAEGAISIAMQRLPVIIDGTEMAVIGYGRIGELLAQKLHSLGAAVTVYARREEILTRARLAHLNAIQLNDFTLKQIARGTRVIFNTVPECIFTEPILQTLPKACLFVDLASAPGGSDRSAAERYGIETVWATALPGKYAPETAGIHIAQTIEDIFHQIT